MDAAEPAVGSGKCTSQLSAAAPPSGNEKPSPPPRMQIASRRAGFAAHFLVASETRQSHARLALRGHHWENCRNRLAVHLAGESQLGP